MDGSTVTVMLRVYAGIDVKVTLDGMGPDQVNAPSPLLEFVFQNVAIGNHTVQVRDVVGYEETAAVEVPVPTTTISKKRPTVDGLCIPAAPLGVSVSDSWTVAGSFQVTGNAPPLEIPEDATQWATTYTVTGIEDSKWVVGPGTREGAGENAVLVPHSKAKVRSEQVWRNADGEVLATREKVLDGATISAPTFGPVLTLDWDCHRLAWLQRPTIGGSPDEGTTRAKHTVEDMTLSSGITARLFLQTTTLSQPDENLELTSDTVFGYDVLTGRLVLIEDRTTGSKNGKPFSMAMAQALVEEGTVPTGGGDTRSATEEGPSDVTFNELFSSPDQYNGRDIILEGFYFHGWESIVLSERLEYSGRAEGHLWPRGNLVWIKNNAMPGEVYDRLYQGELTGPVERYGKLRIMGRFEYGARYGHGGGYGAQIAPAKVELLPWSLPPQQQ